METNFDRRLEKNRNKLRKLLRKHEDIVVRSRVIGQKKNKSSREIFKLAKSSGLMRREAKKEVKGPLVGRTLAITVSGRGPFYIMEGTKAKVKREKSIEKWFKKHNKDQALIHKVVMTKIIELAKKGDREAQYMLVRLGSDNYISFEVERKIRVPKPKKR